MNSEKLLIIGCGDLGQRLADQLGGSGIAITGVRRRPTATTAKVQYRALDANDEKAMTSLLSEGFDYIVLTLTPTQRSEAGYRDGYIKPCQTLVRALAAAGARPRKLLFVSSTSVYGEDRKSTRLNSSHVRISYAVFCLKKKNNQISTSPL